ncbi:MAG: hypothetical protein R3183_02095 [Oleiphilaceae bacterium]|nr:hypothetical protein [Oleiphilaceae bacterium]
MSTLIFAGIVVLILASLIVSAVTYSRQQAFKAKQKKLAQLKSRSDEVLDHLRLLLQIDENYDIIICLQTQLVRFLRGAIQLEPNDRQLAQSLATHTQNLSLYKEGRRPNAVECFVNSDSELSNAQLKVGQIGKYLDICRNRNWIGVQEHDQMSKHLQYLKLDLDVNSHVNQAQICGSEGDIVMYQLHLKQARDALSKTKLDVPNKNARVKELSEMLNYSKRTGKMFGQAESEGNVELTDIESAPPIDGEPSPEPPAENTP